MPRDMTLYGIADTELLAIVDDVADENGWATTFSIRTQLGEDPWLPRKGEGPTSGVGIRLGWLRKYGWLEKGENVKVESDEAEYGWRWSTTWRLTAMGHALIDHPELTRSMERAFGSLTTSQRLRLTRELGGQGRDAPAEIRAALRREWTRSAGLAPHRHK